MGTRAVLNGSTHVHPCGEEDRERRVSERPAGHGQRPSVIEADSLDHATKLASGCLVLQGRL